MPHHSLCIIQHLCNIYCKRSPMLPHLSRKCKHPSRTKKRSTFTQRIFEDRLMWSFMVREILNRIVVHMKNTNDISQVLDFNLPENVTRKCNECDCICLNRAGLKKYQRCYKQKSFIMVYATTNTKDNPLQRCCHICARDCKTLAGLKLISMLPIFEDGSADHIAQN